MSNKSDTQYGMKYCKTDIDQLADETISELKHQAGFISAKAAFNKNPEHCAIYLEFLKTLEDAVTVVEQSKQKILER